MRALGALLPVAAALALAAPAGAQIPGLPIFPPSGQPEPAPPSSPPQNQPSAPPATPPASPPRTGSAAFQVDPAHTGFVDDPTLVPPLQVRWSKKIGENYPAPLAGDGRIFIAGQFGENVVVRAMDARTGRDLWKRVVEKGSTTLAYDDGRLFTSSPFEIRAYDAASGHVIWSTPTGRVVPLVADQGVLYSSLGPEAFRASDGKVLWKGSGGSGGLAALDRERLYVAPGCGDVFAYSRATGARVWARIPGCSGGAPGVPMIAGDRLYEPVENLTLDAATGKELPARLDGYSGTPVFARGVTVFLAGIWLRAFEGDAQGQRWRAQVRPRSTENTSYGSRVTGPLAVYHSVYVMSPVGELRAFGLERGERQSTLPVPAGSQPEDAPAPLGVAPGLLLLASASRLYAFQSVFRPSASGIDLGAGSFDAEYRARNSVGGLLGVGLRTPVRRVRLERDEQPYGRWRRLGTATPGADGFFNLSVRTERNTRFRAIADGRRSDVVTVYTYPRFRISVRRGRGTAINHLTGHIALTAAPGTPFAGRHVHLYIARVAQRRFDRMGSGRLVGAGPGRTRATVSFGALRRVGSDDFYAVCVPGQWKLHYGRHDRFAARCGARRIRVPR